MQGIDMLNTINAPTLSILMLITLELQDIVHPKSLLECGESSHTTAPVMILHLVVVLHRVLVNLMMMIDQSQGVILIDRGIAVEMMIDHMKREEMMKEKQRKLLWSIMMLIET